IVKSCVVHNGRTNAVGIEPFLIAQAFNRDSRTSAKVMQQPKGMTCLMAYHRAYESSHKLIVEVHLLASLIEGTALNHVPGAEHGHDIVVEIYLAGDDLSTSGIGDHMACSVGPFRRLVYDHRMPGIFHVPVGIL